MGSWGTRDRKCDSRGSLLRELLEFAPLLRGQHFPELFHPSHLVDDLLGAYLIKDSLQPKLLDDPRDSHRLDDRRQVEAKRFLALFSHVLNLFEDGGVQGSHPATITLPQC